MTGCHSNRHNPLGYLDLIILTDFAEYANALTEFLLNTIVLDYVVRISMQNYENFLHTTQISNPICMSLYNINLDADFLSYEEKIRRICMKSKATLYDMKTTRLTHPSWIVRFSPGLKRALRVLACNLRHLVKKIGEIEGQILKTGMHGEMIRYHAISTALTTIKYDLVTLYVTIRTGGLTAINTSFLLPLMADAQRWLIYAHYQIKMILAALPGSSVSRRSGEQFKIRRRWANIKPKNCITSMSIIGSKVKKTMGKSEHSSLSVLPTNDSQSPIIIEKANEQSGKRRQSTSMILSATSSRN